MTRVETIWAFLATNHEQQEHVQCVRIGSNWSPAFTATEHGLQVLRPLIEDIAHASGVAIQLARFDLRTNVETIARLRSIKGGIG